MAKKLIPLRLCRAVLVKAADKKIGAVIYGPDGGILNFVTDKDGTEYNDVSLVSETAIEITAKQMKEFQALSTELTIEKSK